jgi:hypothetical protein
MSGPSKTYNEAKYECGHFRMMSKAQAAAVGTGSPRSSVCRTPVSER